VRRWCWCCLVGDGSLRWSAVEVRLQLAVDWLGWQDVEFQEKSLFWLGQNRRQRHLRVPLTFLEASPTAPLLVPWSCSGGKP
jgi:hypothetical protein